MRPLSRLSSTAPFIRRAALTVAVPLALLAQQPAWAGGDIGFRGDTVYAEGIAWSEAQQAFLVGSVRHGTVGRVSLKGEYSPLIQDSALISSVGLTVDAQRNRLWVAIGDLGAAERSSPTTQGKLAAVAAYDLRTGQRVAYHDLGAMAPGSHFANDLALDTQGNVYVTDSFSPVIYRVDTTSKATVFARSELFTGENFNLNGIVAHPDGYLLVNKHNSGELFRIRISEPDKVERVRLPEALNGADGMVLRDAGRLTVVQNSGVDRTLDLVSTDGWKTASIARTQKSLQSFPTTAAAVGKDLYVLNSRLDTLLSADTPKVSDFVLQKY